MDTFTYEQYKKASNAGAIALIAFEVGNADLFEQQIALMNMLAEWLIERF